ncbi:hypothetical protein V6N13_052389 [Hibiscus sabdariffa]
MKSALCGMMKNLIFGFQRLLGNQENFEQFGIKLVFPVEFVSTNTNFILLKGTRSQLDVDIILVNVYVPCQANEQTELWENLCTPVNGFSSEVIAGDFNAVKNRGNGPEV